MLLKFTYILKIAAIEYMKLGDNKVSTFTVCTED